MKVFALFLIFGFGSTIKIDSVKCSTPRSCVVHVNKPVAKDTTVNVNLTDGATVPLTLKAGTQDVFFAPPADYVVGSAKLK